MNHKQTCECLKCRRHRRLEFYHPFPECFGTYNPTRIACHRCPYRFICSVRYYYTERNKK